MQDYSPDSVIAATFAPLPDIRSILPSQYYHHLHISSNTQPSNGPEHLNNTISSTTSHTQNPFLPVNHRDFTSEHSEETTSSSSSSSSSSSASVSERCIDTVDSITDTLSIPQTRLAAPNVLAVIKESLIHNPTRTQTRTDEDHTTDEQAQQKQTEISHQSHAQPPLELRETTRMTIGDLLVVVQTVREWPNYIPVIIEEDDIEDLGIIGDEENEKEDEYVDESYSVSPDSHPVTRSQIEDESDDDVIYQGTVYPQTSESSSSCSSSSCSSSSCSSSSTSEFAQDEQLIEPYTDDLSEWSTLESLFQHLHALICPLPVVFHDYVCALFIDGGRRWAQALDTIFSRFVFNATPIHVITDLESELLSYSQLSIDNQVFALAVKILAFSPPSESPCERVFSMGKFISGKRRFRMSDVALNSGLHSAFNRSKLAT